MRRLISLPCRRRSVPPGERVNERGLSDIADRNDNRINDDDDDNGDTPKPVLLYETHNLGSSLPEILRAPNFEIICEHMLVMFFAFSVT